MLAIQSISTRAAYWASSPAGAAQPSVSTLSSKTTQPAAESAPSALASGAVAHRLGPAMRGAQAYQAVQAAEAATATAPTQNPFATTILNFMAKQLARDAADGATPEALQSRLAAGLSGFEQGFREASAQLQASGLLNQEVSQAIGETHSQVLAGVNALAEHYGLAPLTDQPQAPQAPVDAPAAPRASLSSLQKTLLDSLPKPQDLLKQLDEGVTAERRVQGQMRDFQFEVITQEGDRVTLHAGAKTLQATDSTRQGLQLVHNQQSQFNLTVEGDINEAELNAISQLLDKVTALSDTFFNGNLEDAFNQAQNFGFSSSEISQFALNLQRVDVQKVQQAYAVPAADGPKLSPLNRWDALGQFVKQLEDAKTLAQQNALPLALITQLTQDYSAYAYERHPQQDAASARIEALLQA